MFYSSLSSRSSQLNIQANTSGSTRLNIKQPIVRLRGGYSPDTGYLEYYDTNGSTSTGSWKTICDPFETWNISVCNYISLLTNCKAEKL